MCATGANSVEMPEIVVVMEEHGESVHRMVEMPVLHFKQGTAINQGQTANNVKGPVGNI